MPQRLISKDHKVITATIGVPFAQGIEHYQAVLIDSPSEGSERGQSRCAYPLPFNLGFLQMSNVILNAAFKLKGQKKRALRKQLRALPLQFASE